MLPENLARYVSGGVRLFVYRVRSGINARGISRVDFKIMLIVFFPFDKNVLFVHNPLKYDMGE